MPKKTKKTKAYLCGPMTYIPQFNFPEFDREAKRLRKTGDWIIISPAKLDDPETRRAALASPDGAPGSGATRNETWGDFLARDIKLIADGGIEAILTLPKWWRSEGGRLETFVASLPRLGLPVLKANNLRPVTQKEWRKAVEFILAKTGGHDAVR